MKKRLDRNGIAIIKPKRHGRTLHSDQSRDKRLISLFTQQKGLCFYCGKLCSLSDEHRFEHNYAATLDHVVPISCGGITDFKNLVMCCNFCNNLKGNTKLGLFQQKHFPEGLAGMQEIDSANPIYPLIIKLLKPVSPDHPRPPYKP